MIKGRRMVHFPAFLHLVAQTPLFICFFQSQTNCMETLVVTWMVQDMSRLLWNPKVYKSSLIDAVWTVIIEPWPHSSVPLSSMRMISVRGYTLLVGWCIGFHCTASSLYIHNWNCVLYYKRQNLKENVKVYKYNAQKELVLHVHFCNTGRLRSEVTMVIKLYNKVEFYILLTVHLGVIQVNNQLDALFSMYLFHFSTCFERPSALHQENQLYQYIIWYISLL